MVKHIELDIDYDKKGDVLDIFVGKPYDTDNHILDYNYTLRLDPETKNLVGLIVIDFSKLFPESQKDEDRRFVSRILFKIFQQLHREKTFNSPRVA